MKSKKLKDAFGQRFNLGWALAVSVFVFIILVLLLNPNISGAQTYCQLAAEKDTCYTGNTLPDRCEGRPAGTPCTGTLTSCTPSPTGSNPIAGCYATPASCRYYGSEALFGCEATKLCPDSDNDGIPLCIRSSGGPPDSRFTYDSALGDCNDSDPWSHSYGSKDVASVKVEYAPAYVAKTQTEKKFTPDPKKLNPLLGDFLITVTFKAKKCGMATTPDLVPMKVYYTTKDSSGNEVSLLLISATPDNRTLGNLTKVSDLVYRGLISESMDPRLQPAVEPYIASVAAGRPVELKFVGPDIGPNKDAPKYQPLPMTNCAQVYGKGNVKTVFMRGSSPLVPLRDLQNATAVFISNYTKSEPFKSYLGHFKHYMDLAPYYDNYPFSNTLGMMNHYVPQDAGSCGKDKQVRLGYHFLISNNTDRTYTNGNGRTVLMEADDKDIYQEHEAVALHEFGHVFANLADEYIYSPKASLTQNAVLYFYTYKGLGKNCSTQPATDFSYGGKLFGGKLLGSSMTPDYFAGCSFGQTAGGKSLYRPSNDSLMRQDGAIHFNVVSCGQILKAIKKTKTGAENFSECATKKDAIIPVGQ